ncbi:MAG TPA: SRPBCC family protein [Steroidobacteraceae bacterium]|nr:SRPBCC family protein [Steroidobacteraceae bacterium]
MREFLIIATLGALATTNASATSSWLDSHDVQQQLAAGQVVVRGAMDGRAMAARVDAAVKVHADRDAIWGVLKDCDHAPSFIPGLKRCQRVASAPDGSWEVIAHDVKYSWFMPTIHSVFRADYQRPSRIDFHRIGGDLKDEQGSWLLEPLPDGSGTIVEYQMQINPGFWIPQAIVHRSLRKELPEALAALRIRVESLQAARR